MLKVRQLAYSFDAIESDIGMQMHFELEVFNGEILSLIGPSGSGKTTLLNLIAGFITASAGDIWLDGQNITRLGPAERPLSMVFQAHNLFPHLDVFTNVALGINPSLRLSAEQLASIDDALDKLGLAGLNKRKPGQLSGGQQQRVALARVLVRKQPLLLLDEPFAALGPALREELIEILNTLVRKENMAAIMVSHQPADALLTSARTAFVSEGRIIVTDTTEAILKEPDLQQVKNYLGSM